MRFIAQVNSLKSWQLTDIKNIKVFTLIKGWDSSKPSVSKLALSPVQFIAITWIIAALLLTGSLGTKLREFLIKTVLFLNIIYRIPAILSRPQCFVMDSREIHYP